MSLIDKYKCTLEKIVKIEESGKYRCGYMYEITIKSNNGKNSELKEKTLYVDLNHRFRLENGKVIFEKNKKPTNRNEDWDYNKDPFEIVAISIMPQCSENSTFIKMFNSLYKEQEIVWRANYNKEERNDCMAHESNLTLENKNLLL